MSISNQWENEILDHIFNNAAAPAVTTPYISLHTADPGETGASELAGGSYARQSGGFGNASGGTVSNTANIDFTGMPAGTITHVGVWSSSTATATTNFVWGGALTASKAVNSGDTFRLATGNLDVTLD